MKAVRELKNLEYKLDGTIRNMKIEINNEMRVSNTQKELIEKKMANSSKIFYQFKYEMEAFQKDLKQKL